MMNAECRARDEGGRGRRPRSRAPTRPRLKRHRSLLSGKPVRRLRKVGHGRAGGIGRIEDENEQEEEEEPDTDAP